MPPKKTATSAQKAQFAAVGDIFLGDQPICLGFGVRSLAKRKSYRSLFDDIKTTLALYPLVIGNLETVIADQSSVASTKSAGLIDRADPDAAAALCDAGINMVSLANNHIFEYGVTGLTETVRHLDAHRIESVGRKNYIIRDVGGNKVAFLSWSLLPDTYWPDLGPADYYNVASSINPILDEIKTVKSNVDFVVLMLHWGNESVHRPSKQQQDLGRALIDAGVNVILGHHPHVLQPIERYKNGVIAYSLGNFVMDSWETPARRSIILEITLGGSIEYRAIPVTIDGRTYRPSLTKNDAEKSLTISMLGCGEPLEDSEYLNLVHRARKRYRRSSVVHFMKNIHRFGIRNLAWALGWGLRRVVFLIRVAGMEKKDPNIVYRGPMH